MNISAESYHADKCGTPQPSVSSGLIKKILLGNMHHVWLDHPRLNPHFLPRHDAKFSTGQAAHELILEGGETGRIVIVDPELYRSSPTKDNPDGNVPLGWTNKAIKEARDSILSIGKTPILKSDYADVERMASAFYEAVANEPELKGLKLGEHGTAEQTIIWQEKAGAWCRARPDWLAHDHTLMIDLKTTSATTPDQWERSYLSQMGFDVQQEHYCRGVEAMTGTRPRWIWAVQQDFYPYDVWFVEPEEDMREGAKIECELAYRLFSECLTANKWPSWPKGIRRATQTKFKAQETEQNAITLDWFDRDMPSAREAFLFGSVDHATRIPTGGAL